MLLSWSCMAADPTEPGKLTQVVHVDSQIMSLWAYCKPPSSISHCSGVLMGAVRGAALLVTR